MNDISDLLAQYETDAVRLAARIAETKNRLKTERSSAVWVKLRRALPIYEQEYRDLLAGIRSMRKYLEPKSETGDFPQAYRYEKVCPRCGKIFRTNYGQKIYCSSGCQMGDRVKIAYRRSCKNCGKDFIPERTNQIYCSPDCRHRYHSNKYAKEKR